MEVFDVAIVGAGPAGSACAGFCALAGLRPLVLEREKFPREKVCGDCLNPSVWPVMERLGLAERVRQLAHAILSTVEFIAIGGRKVAVDLPSGEEGEISIKRSLFDALLLSRAREFGAQIYEETAVTALTGGTNGSDWKIHTNRGPIFAARTLVGADGRNSTIARLCNLLPRLARERVALQAHIPLPPGFGDRVVLQSKIIPGARSLRSPARPWRQRTTNCFWSATRRAWWSRLPGKEFITHFAQENWRRRPSRKSFVEITMPIQRVSTRKRRRPCTAAGCG